jgi:pyruvate/2-oxoglutarate dehydrogenase complex dihydrolipoamide acyltransferase (E2) component
MSTARRNDSRSLTIFTLALLLGGCGGKDSETDTADQTAAAEAEAEPEASAPPDEPTEEEENPVEAPLAAEDIDRWDKGMEAELNAVRQGQEKLKIARTQEDSVNAMLEVQETAEEGGKAAGLDPERYRFVDTKLSDLASSLSSWTGSDTTSDTTGVEGAVGEEMRRMQEAAIQNASEEVPPEVVEAMKPRADELNQKSRHLSSEQLKIIGFD